MKIVDDIEPP